MELHIIINGRHMEMDLIEEFVRKKSGKDTYRSWLNTFFTSIGYLEKVLRVLQKILGHTSLDTTQIYLDIVAKDVIEDYQKVEF